MTNLPTSRQQAILLKDSLPKTRQEALAEGQKFYYPDQEPCPRNHDSPRTTNNGFRCVMCLQDKNRKQRDKPEAWIETADSAERRARKRAEEAECLPEDYDMEECRGFYRLAHRLSEETGIPHEVDHEIPLSKGGGTPIRQPPCCNS